MREKFLIEIFFSLKRLKKVFLSFPLAQAVQIEKNIDLKYLKQWFKCFLN